MNRIILITLVVFICAACFSQSYVARAKRKINLHIEPNSQSGTVMKLNTTNAIFVITTDKINDFYHVIDIQTAKEGYVHRLDVNLREKVEEHKGNILTISGEISSDSISDIIIKNDTESYIFVKFNDLTFRFSPGEIRDISLLPGNYRYVAYSQGVMPIVGTEELQAGKLYEWEFYRTKRK